MRERERELTINIKYGLCSWGHVKYSNKWLMWHATNGTILMQRIFNWELHYSKFIYSACIPSVLALPATNPNTYGKFNTNPAHHGRESLPYDDAIEQKNKLLVKFVHKSHINNAAEEWDHEFNLSRLSVALIQITDFESRYSHIYREKKIEQRHNL